MVATFTRQQNDNFLQRGDIVADNIKSYNIIIMFYYKGVSV